MSAAYPQVLLSLLRGQASQLVLSSGLAVVLLGARVVMTGQHDYLFLVWNLFLAWVPFAIAMGIRWLHQRRVRTRWLVPLFAVWLAFLPNAPYLVTDFVHLRYRIGAPLWFDAVMLASFAWAGVGLGAASLRVCSRIVRVRNGPLAAAGFVPLAALATGFGIYLGRFVRLNTWDVATRPTTVLSHAFSPFAHPFGHPLAWIVTFTFSLFFVVAYLSQPASSSSGRGGKGSRPQRLAPHTPP